MSSNRNVEGNILESGTPLYEREDYAEPTASSKAPPSRKEEFHTARVCRQYIPSISCA